MENNRHQSPVPTGQAQGLPKPPVQQSEAVSAELLAPPPAFDEGTPDPGFVSAPEVPLEIQEPVMPKTSPVLHASERAMPAPSTKGIAVTANAKGFYRQNRWEPNDKFVVPSLERVATWMTIDDPQLEEERQARDKLKRAERQKEKQERERHFRGRF